MNIQDLIIKYEEIRKKLKALNYAMWIISWDTETEAPSGALTYRAQQIGVLAEESYQLTTATETLEIVNELFSRRSELTLEMSREIYLVHKGIQEQLKIPMKEYVEFQMLVSQTQSIWADAKRASNFELFLPSLEKIVTMIRSQIKYLETEDLKGYDVLLDRFEEGMTSYEYDAFFDILKKDLVPVVTKVINKSAKVYDFEKLTFPVNLQKEFVEYLIDVLAFDRKHGLIKESEHPFTSGVSVTDVRITNHYYENNFTSSIFSAIHELGHALYEQQVDPALDDTLLMGGASMAIHESQSRFYENIIGRSYHFWEAHYPKLQSIFKEQLQNVTLDDFYQSINKSFASFIRTDADELTYPLHIMIRYEIERDLMEGRLEVKDLPKVWNQLMESYLGIVPRSDSEGVLQDVHWSGGMFGYFPTYALGSAYSAQIYHEMQKDIDFEKELVSGSTKVINNWLKERIHQFGQVYSPKELFKRAIGNFDASYYVKYLTDKYLKN